MVRFEGVRGWSGAPSAWVRGTGDLVARTSVPPASVTRALVPRAVLLRMAAAGIVLAAAGCAETPPAAPVGTPIVLQPPPHTGRTASVARRRPAASGASVAATTDTTGLSPTQKEALFRSFMETRPVVGEE